MNRLEVNTGVKAQVDAATDRLCEHVDKEIKSLEGQNEEMAKDLKKTRYLIRKSIKSQQTFNWIITNFILQNSNTPAPPDLTEALENIGWGGSELRLSLTDSLKSEGKTPIEKVTRVDVEALDKNNEVQLFLSRDERESVPVIGRKKPARVGCLHSHSSRLHRDIHQRIEEQNLTPEKVVMRNLHLKRNDSLVETNAIAFVEQTKKGATPLKLVYQKADRTEGLDLPVNWAVRDRDTVVSLKERALKSPVRPGR